jgi:hypothetical protein
LYFFVLLQIISERLEGREKESAAVDEAANNSTEAVKKKFKSNFPPSLPLLAHVLHLARVLEGLMFDFYYLFLLRA